MGDALAFPVARARSAPRAVTTEAEVVTVTTRRAGPWKRDGDLWVREDLETAPNPCDGWRDRVALVRTSGRWKVYTRPGTSRYFGPGEPCASIAVAFTEATARLRSLGFSVEGPDVPDEALDVGHAARAPAANGAEHAPRVEALVDLVQILRAASDPVLEALLRGLRRHGIEAAAVRLGGLDLDPADLPPGVLPLVPRPFHGRL